mmetsp:Transcript_44591/g.59163  ORF Transcript_44591/g.59163 Transcript_44591/m.59163 type:complete len:144 (+) Transcript_44591:87-518(+)
MKAKHYLLVPLILASLYSNAQTNKVQEWSEANPSVLFVENNDATEEYLASLEEKDIDYIVYDHEISLADIDQFEAKNKPVSIADLDETDAMEIKKWVSTHPDIKIIKRSIFDQMEPSKQSIYLNQNALILIGDEITLEDIRNF